MPSARARSRCHHSEDPSKHALLLQLDSVESEFESAFKRHTYRTLARAICDGQAISIHAMASLCRVSASSSNYPFKKSTPSLNRALINRQTIPPKNSPSTPPHQTSHAKQRNGARRRRGDSLDVRGDREVSRKLAR